MNIQEFVNHMMNGIPERLSVMLRGPHGIGKSAIIRYIAKEISKRDGKPFEVVDLRLSQKEVGDLIGLPKLLDTFNVVRDVYVKGELEKTTVVAKDVTVYHAPVWWPQDPNSRGFLFLDEINRATKETQQAAFELVYDYRLNFHELPMGWTVVAAINDNTEVYSVQEMDVALEDRFDIVDFRPQVEEWLDYAKSTKIHDSIVKYITKFPTTLDAPEKGLEPGKIYPSRRSWEQLSRVVERYKETGTDLIDLQHNDYLIKVAGGFVGSATAIQYANFIKKDYRVLTAEDILNKYDDELDKVIEKVGVSEGGYCNKIILEYAKKNGHLNPKQQKNLFRYYKKVGKECAADFFNMFTREAKEVCSAWYNSDSSISDYTLGVLGRSRALAVDEKDPTKAKK